MKEQIIENIIEVIECNEPTHGDYEDIIIDLLNDLTEEKLEEYKIRFQ